MIAFTAFLQYKGVSKRNVDNQYMQSDHITLL